jgi:hypothetical protein
MLATARWLNLPERLPKRGGDEVSKVHLAPDWPSLACVRRLGRALGWAATVNALVRNYGAFLYDQHRSLVRQAGGEGMAGVLVVIVGALTNGLVRLDGRGAAR